MPDGDFSLADLERLANTRQRTIRSYIERGLLPRPDSSGRHASYSRVHLDRLRAVRVLLDIDNLGLSEVYGRLMTLSDDEVAAIAARLPLGEQPLREVPDDTAGISASAYVQALRAKLKSEPAEELVRETATAPPIGPPASSFDTTSSFVMESARAADTFPFAEQRRGETSSDSPAVVPRRPTRPTLHLQLLDALRENGEVWRSVEQRLAAWHVNLERLHSANEEVHARLSARDELGHELRHHVRALQQTVRDLVDRLEAERHRARGAVAPAAVPPSQPGAATTIESFIRILVAPDVEILVRGAPDNARLVLIQRIADQFKQALCEVGDNDS